MSVHCAMENIILNAIKYESELKKLIAIETMFVTKARMFKIDKQVPAQRQAQNEIEY